MRLTGFSESGVCMSLRRLAIDAVLVTLFAVMFFALGTYTAERINERDMADRDARIDALRRELIRGLSDVRASGTGGSGTATAEDGKTAAVGQATIVEEVKKQLRNEMGLLPVRLLRERRKSFVELYAYDDKGRSSYGTAGYLGNGYFITVKHAVVLLGNDDDVDARDRRHIVSIKVVFGGRTLPAHLIDAGNADVEVDPGDWAIIKVAEKVDLPPLTPNPDFSYDFADPIFRLGNDYSKGIILSTGYVGQRTSNGLVTCLTDGHPGVSGGGVLDQDGDLVGIPIGRMQGDFRFSFILPLRRDMLRKVPGLQGASLRVAADHRTAERRGRTEDREPATVAAAGAETNKPGR